MARAGIASVRMELHSRWLSATMVCVCAVGRPWPVADPVHQHVARSQIGKLRAEDQDRGWAAGDEGTILKTTEWRQLLRGRHVEYVEEPAFGVWAVDEQLAYVCGDSVEVWRTEDGGSTWE